MKQLQVALFILSLFAQAIQAQPGKQTDLLDLSSTKISEISTNKVWSDFGPTIIGNDLYYTSFKDAIPGKSSKSKDMSFYDLFKVKTDSSGMTTSSRELIPESETRFHEGPISWCEKTGEMFYTQSNYVDPAVKYKAFRNEGIKLRILVAKQVGGSWETVSEFPYNNANYSVGHPAINVSGDTLYFSSDMSGGYGATDLYYSVRKNGQWSEPENLGSEINTAGKEEFPFITGDGFPGRYLIFASTAHGSMGGLDLFYKNLGDPKSKVIPFPTPINSVNDDFSMSLSDQFEYGYMTSDRPGTGSDDIYRFTFNRNLDYLKEIFVLDLLSKKPIQGATVDLCNLKKSNTGSAGIVSMKFKKGAICDVKASAAGYQDNQKLVYMGTPKNGKFPRDTIFLTQEVKKEVTLRNVYYDFDKWNILPEAAAELDRLVILMKENPTLKVELASHTDERGDVPYNIRLSQRRAESVVNYLVSKGIDKSRIKAQGFGKSILIHKSSVKSKLTPMEHRENRRTEIIIPGFIKAEPVKQVKGDFSMIQ